jgi:PAS domain S-box-containing protein
MKSKQRAKATQESPAQIWTAASYLNTLLASVADGLLVTDKSDTIILVNKSAEEIFGMQAKDLTNLTLQELLNRYVVNVLDLDKPSAMGDIRRFDIEVSIRAHQDNRVLQVTTLPVYDKAGKEIEGAVTLFHDSTREREIERMRTEFVNSAAHELRTPLTSIRGFSELLLEKNFSPEEQKKFLLHINQQSKQLTLIINNLLDGARIKTGQGMSDFQPSTNNR